MVSKKKKQKKQTNNAIPENWIIKKNIKENKVHKYYSNRDNIGDLTNRRIFIDNYLKEQEQQKKDQLILNDREVIRQFDKIIKHSNTKFKKTTQPQIAGRHYINSLKQKSFNALLQNAESNKQQYYEEKQADINKKAEDLNTTKQNLIKDKHDTDMMFAGGRYNVKNAMKSFDNLKQHTQTNVIKDVMNDMKNIIHYNESMPFFE
jgi:hypothetical protein